MKRYLWVLALFAGLHAWGQTVVSGEYFVDADAGYGQNIPLLFVAGTDIELSLDDFSLSSTGRHFLGLRFKNDNGQWGQTRIWSFYATLNPNETGSIASVNFVVSGPDGEEILSGNQEAAGSEVDLLIPVILAAEFAEKRLDWQITPLNTLGQQGRTNTFTQFATFAVESAPITDVEYQVGGGAFFTLPVSPGQFSLEDFQFSVTTENDTSSEQALSIRVRDALDRWSPTLSVNLEVEGTIAPCELITCPEPEDPCTEVTCVDGECIYTPIPGCEICDVVECDCNNEPGGSAVIDDCGICLEPTDPEFNISCLDCAGVVDGSAAIDQCGECTGGTTGLTPNASCADCNNVPNGTASIDECGLCTGGNTGLAPNASCSDCAGVPNGIAALDDCGDCTGGTTGLAPNEGCLDCAGVPNGEASLDNCGTCTGGTTGLEPCTADCAGTFGGSSILDECGVCRLPDDPNFNSTCSDCAGVPNGTAFVDLCGLCAGGSTGIVPNTVCLDCFGAINGTAFIDECGQCAGGLTGVEACVEDCAGIFGGSSIFDECGVCRLPDDPDFNSTCLDCVGVPNGSSEIDLCGECLEAGMDNPQWNACVDCNGMPFGEAVVDNCGECTGGDTGVEACATDCAGIFGGSSILDECGVCRLPDDPDFNSTCLDCAGVPNGTAETDECGTCIAGGTSNPDFNASCADCAGVPNGSSEIDFCGECLEGGMDNPLWNACVDCNGVPFGEAVVDNCGECTGGDTGVEACATDCAGIFGGSSIFDECGVCRLPDDPDFNSTCLDCDGAVNGPNVPGTLCESDGLPGIVNTDCSCTLVNLDAPCRFFMSDYDFETGGGSEIYELFFDEDGNRAVMVPHFEVPYRATLAYDADSATLYLVNVDAPAYQTAEFSDFAPVLTPEVTTLDFDADGFAGAAWSPGGYLAVASENPQRLSLIDVQTGQRLPYSPGKVSGGDIAFDAEGTMKMVSRDPARAFNVLPGVPNEWLTNVGDSASGLMLRADANFLLLRGGDSRLLLGAPDGSSLGMSYRLFLGGELFTTRDGDLASGCTLLQTPIEMQRLAGSGTIAGGAALRALPNPTSGLAYVAFTVNQPQRAVLEVYDLSGRRIDGLFDARAEAGREYSFTYDAADLPNGVYLFRLAGMDEVLVEKVVVTK